MKKILFIAKYAPNYDNEFVAKNPKDLLYAQYHQDIYNILKKNFDVTSATCPDKLIKYYNCFDFVFSLLNKMNFRNSEIFISSLCEYYKIPYLGATPNIRAIAEDKHIAKLQAEKLNINTPPWIIVNYNEDISQPPFDGPYFIKPRFGATSVDIDDSCVCETYKNLKIRVNEFQAKKTDVIIEKYICGKTYTVGVLNNFGKTLVLPVIEESGKSTYGITTYEEKRKIEKGLTRSVVNSSFSSQIQNNTKKYFENLKPIDYARFDYIVEKDTDKIYFIEFNLCCNLGRASAIALGASELNIPYDNLINNITYSSLYRQCLLNDVDIYKF